MGVLFILLEFETLIFLPTTACYFHLLGSFPMPEPYFHPALQHQKTRAAAASSRTTKNSKERARQIIIYSSPFREEFASRVFQYSSRALAQKICAFLAKCGSWKRAAGAFLMMTMQQQHEQEQRACQISAVSLPRAVYAWILHMRNIQRWWRHQQQPSIIECVHQHNPPLRGSLCFFRGGRRALARAAIAGTLHLIPHIFWIHKWTPAICCRCAPAKWFYYQAT